MQGMGQFHRIQVIFLGLPGPNRHLLWFLSTACRFVRSAIYAISIHFPCFLSLLAVDEHSHMAGWEGKQIPHLFLSHPPSKYESQSASSFPGGWGIENIKKVKATQFIIYTLQQLLDVTYPFLWVHSVKGTSQYLAGKSLWSTKKLFFETPKITQRTKVDYFPLQSPQLPWLISNSLHQVANECVVSVGYNSITCQYLCQLISYYCYCT